MIKAQFSLFTVIPVNVTGEDVDDLSRHLWTLPLIGLFYGAVAGGSFYALTRLLDPLVSAAVVVLLVHGLNRFLHFDGLIDLGDGLIATGTHEKKMAAMKDTRVGAGGGGFGMMFTLLAVASLASVGEVGYAPMMFFLPLAAEVLSKNALVTVAALGRPREGLGSPFVSNTRPGHAVLSAVLSLILLAAVFLALGQWSPRPQSFIPLLMALASVAVGAAAAVVAHRSFGCVNGDVLGATNELAKPFVLIAGVAGVVLFLSMY